MDYCLIKQINQQMNIEEKTVYQCIGFKLTSSGDYDIQNKRLVNVDNPANLKDAISYGTANTHFLNLDGSTL